MLLELEPKISSERQRSMDSPLSRFGLSTPLSRMLSSGQDRSSFQSKSPFWHLMSSVTTLATALATLYPATTSSSCLPTREALIRSPASLLVLSLITAPTKPTTLFSYSPQRLNSLIVLIASTSNSLSLFRRLTIAPLRSLCRTTNWI